MSTSLREQLERLRTPQTSLLLEDKKKPSLLFDFKEAANLDRETVFNIGLSGLSELIELRSVFREFEGTLFSQSSLNLERSIHDTEVNEKLDKSVERFLIFLSPYFLLNSARKSLEWLIHRFRIHQYNKDAFLLLILPYYETPMFARALQLMEVSDASDKWNWLQSVKKAKVPLSSLTLINRTCSDNGFLKLICNYVVKATKIYGSQATSLTTLYNFYTLTLTQSIHRLSSISEVQINHMLPTLIKGLSSSIENFAASSYMILFILNIKVKLRDETLDYLIYKSLKRPNLHLQVLFFVNFFCNALNNPVTMLSDRIIVRLSSHSWFVDTLSELKTLGIDTTKFIGLFLETSLCYILINSSDESECVRNTMEEIFTKVKLSDGEINYFFCELLFTKKPVSLAKDTESKKYLINLYKSLERTYPTRFDEYLMKVMHLSKNNEEANATLKFLMSWHEGARECGGSMEILNSLNHASPENRILALKIISKSDVTISENFKDSFNDSLLARFDDDEDRVVETLLSFSTKRLKELFPIDVLIKKLMILVSKCSSSSSNNNNNNNSRKMVAEPALKILLDIFEDGDNVSVFLVALPYLFPMKNDNVEIGLQILESNFGRKNKFMQMLKEELELSTNLTKKRLTAKKAKDADNISNWMVTMSFHSLLNKNLLPSTDIIIKTIEEQMIHGDAAFLFFNMLLLGSSCRIVDEKGNGNLDLGIAKKAIELVSEVIKNFKNIHLLPDVRQLEGQNIPKALLLTSKGKLPLQALTYVLETVHRYVPLETKSLIVNLERETEESEFIIKMLEILFEGLEKKYMRSHYERVLSIFFQRHFTDLESIIRFLSQLFNEPVKKQMSLNALYITLQLLNDYKSFQEWIYTDKIFVSNLLISLTSKVNACREAAVKILEKITHQTDSNSIVDGFVFFILLRKLSERKADLNVDPEQLPILLYYFLSPDPDVRYCLLIESERDKLKVAQELFFSFIKDKNLPLHLRAQLLSVLSNVNGTSIVKDLAPLGIELLERAKIHPKNKYISLGLTNILKRINSNTISALKDDKKVWKLIEMSISDHTCQILTEDNGVLSPSVIMINLINETFYENLGNISKRHQKELFSILLEILTNCEDSVVIPVARSTFRELLIDAQFIIDELKLMTLNKVSDIINKSESGTRGGGRKRLSELSILQNPEIVNSQEWRRGITLLEFIKTENHIKEEEKLIRTLFDLLKVCLSFEIQDPIEYTNQLLLSALQYLASRVSEIKEAHLHIAVVAECIRISRNPQTHYYALSLLVTLFKLIKLNNNNESTQSALNNIMPIFTFMGSSVLRQEDAYSIQLTTKIIETIIPVMNVVKDEKKACELLRLFITSLPDIPEHRRIPIFVKLLQLLENYLHLYYLFTFDSHVLSQNSNETTSSNQKIEFALLISQEFPVKKMLSVCLKLVQFLRMLPVEIDEEQKKWRRLNFEMNHIFNVEKNSPKQLRHYKYAIVQFLSKLLSRPEFVNRVAELNSDCMTEMMADFDGLIIELLLVIENTSKSADINQGKPKGKYWKVLLKHLYDILDSVNSLLPNKTFIESVTRLIDHELLSVRRKALELLNLRLQQRNFTKDDDDDDLLNLMNSFANILQDSSQEMEVIQQIVLISIKLLAKLLAAEYPKNFKTILELTTQLIKTRSGPVLASAIVCVGELCSTMRIHAIHSLNKFFPMILHILEKQSFQQVPDIVMISVVCALQKIIDIMANFMSPYLHQLLFEISRLNSFYTDSDDNPKISIVVSKLKATRNKLATSVTLRVLLPAIKSTYDKLIMTKSYKYIGSLLNILEQSFDNLQSFELNAALSDLIQFFLNVLEFREQVESDERMIIDGEENILDCIKTVEESVSKTMVALVLRLSEDSFRPFYYRLYDWAVRNPQHKQRNITFYRLSATIADSLKSLFALFADHFLKHAALILSTNNLSKSDQVQETTLVDEPSQIELIEMVMLTLNKVFFYNENNFVTQERCKILLQPIVDQIDNVIGGKIEEYEKRANDLIVPCIASFAKATTDDLLHKQLLYEILLKSRNTQACVRHTALNCMVEIAKKLGEDFMTLLPETVPFLAELLEDEDETIEKSAQSAVRTLEEILGEPLQKYF